MLAVVAYHCSRCKLSLSIEHLLKAAESAACTTSTAAAGGDSVTAREAECHCIAYLAAATASYC